MIRRNFIKEFSIAGLVPWLRIGETPARDRVDDRAYWTETAVRIATPVLRALAEGRLKERMPVECAPGALESRKKVTHLEAIGRTLAGISPWLELGPDESAEGRKRAGLIEWTARGIKHAVDPSSPDYLNFTQGGQPLVDAAFLAHALIRAPRQLWGNLDAATKTNLVTALKATRVIKPGYNNWLLFTAMVEAALLKFTGEFDAVRIDYAIRQHLAWYKGDGVYGDGPDFHFDYYNSYVIQPMMLDIMKTLLANNAAAKEQHDLILARAQRYAAIQERLISPEGTFPAVGRSLAYRCGAFQLLAQLALQKELPPSLPPGQVRSALTAVIRRTIEAPGTFDTGGWLTIGLSGHQPGVGETYISTGSVYLCSVALLPLGLPADDAFWTTPPEDWTSRKAFAGKDFPIDKALGK